MLVAVVATTAIITCLGVFYRYVMDAALPWPEELSGYLLVWITFGGGYIAARQNAHISFDYFVNMLPRPVGNVIQTLVDISLLALFAFLFVISMQMSINLGSTPLQAIDVPESVFMISIPIFAGGVFLHLAEEFISKWRRR